MAMDHASDQARFVPTLTEIVEVHGQEQTTEQDCACSPGALEGVPDQSVPPQDLTVTALAEDGAVQSSTDSLPQAPWSDALAEQMVHRVIQRVDVLLTQRVAEVIASVIEAQTRTLLPSIRQELEFAIRNSVNEAVADELSHMDEALKSTD